MQDYFIGAAIALAALAGWSAFMDWRRTHRDELDRVGWVNWPLSMVLALVGALMMTMLAFAAG